MNSSNGVLAALLTASLALGGCVSASPRPYAPVLQTPPPDQVAFERDFSACASEVAAGRRSFGQSGGAIAVVAVGGAATAEVVGGGALAAATLGGAGAASTLVVSGIGILVLLPATLAYGLSNARRRRNEHDIQQAMSACLAQTGRTVSGWTRVSSPQSGAPGLLTPTRHIPPAS